MGNRIVTKRMNVTVNSTTNSNFLSTSISLANMGNYPMSVIVLRLIG